MGEDPGDPRLPSLVDPSNPKRAIGLGPVPPTWWSRKQALGGADPVALAVHVPTLRATIDLAYFNAAPEDQRTPHLRGDETVRLSGLHPAMTELEFRLPGLRAHAALELGAARLAIQLEADTLWIEGEMLRCTLTWRGVIPVDAAMASVLDQARILCTLAKGDAAPVWERRDAARSEPALLGGAAVAEGSSIFSRSASIELELEHSMVFAPQSAKPLRVPRRVTPNVPVVNETGLQAWTIPWQVKPPEHSIVVVVKATFALGDDGELALAAEQDPPSGDVFHEAVESASGNSLRYASDFAVFKPAADLLLVGHAYPGEPTAGVASVELRVGDFRRRLAVFGDRKWGGFGFEGKPARFEKMPLRWERALGGPLSEANPVGRGFKTGVMLPNLERPEQLVETKDDRPPPACFAPVAASWKARQAKLGTYDASWLKERWPYLPADFDWSHFNAAPPDQQVPYLRGDERYSIAGVRPNGGGFTGQLPGLRPRVFAQRTEETGGAFFEVLLRLDTAWFDTDSRKVVLLWRGLFLAADEDSPDIAALFVDVEQGAVVRSIAEARERFFARIAAQGALPTAALAFPDDPIHEPVVRAQQPPPPAALARVDVLARLASGGSLARVDLTGADLGGADLTGADLTGAVLARALLTGAVLDRARLAGAVLSGARAEGASFVGADLTGADLAGAELGRAVFTKAVLSRTVLDGARANAAMFAEVQADHASFVGASLEDAVLDRARLTSADLSRTLLARASFRAAVLDDARMYDARGEGAVFDKASMKATRAEKASLVRATLAGVVAPGSVWESADLTGATFHAAQLPEAIFVRATLDDAVLSKATATGASFRRASLRRARCLRTNLMNALFERADLTEADLRGANLYQAETWRAKTGRVDLSMANLAGTKLARSR
jgi:uncharacterized protein YjbI with pentapeptide repeats